MISVRKSCFETNSSSMHSLAIWKKVKPYDKYYLSLGTMYDKDKENGEFELLEHCYSESDYNFNRHPYQQLTTPIEKLRYVIGLFIDYKYPVDEKTGECDYDAEAEYYFEDKEIEAELLRLIEKYTGYKKVKWYTEVEDWKFVGKGTKKEWYTRKEYPSTSTYNDSGEDVLNFIKRKNISLEDLIFKPNYTIQVDGDEYGEFKDMFDFGAINLDNLEDISSGVDYWIDNIFTFYVDEVRKDWGPTDDCKPYLEHVKEDLKEGMVIEIHDFEYMATTEEDYKVASDFLKQYNGKCKFEFHHRITQENKEKYFSWIKEE